MSQSRTYTPAESNAFAEEFELGPWAGGPLNGLQFAVSELIDVEGRPTGCGNPAWLEKRPPAACNALCLDILLSTGAQCIGKTRADEFTFSLLGESAFSGTPLNPRAPERVPGGSSSGAASAVACRLVDFAVALDSGAATQVTASNCGLYGFRPRHGRVPMAGVLSLAPSFDTIGILSSSAGVLAPVAGLLSGLQTDLPPQPAAELYLLSDAWSLADSSVANSLKAALNKLEETLNLKSSKLALKRITKELGGDNLLNWYQTYYELYSMESWSSIGTWIEDVKPILGEEARKNIDRARLADRSESAKSFKRRESYALAINKFLGARRIICIPSASEIAPRKLCFAGKEDLSSYYPSTLALASLSAIGRLAQLSVPLAECQGVPVGLSLLAANEAMLATLLRQIQ